jgi:hypothetical protein
VRATGSRDGGAGDTFWVNVGIHVFLDRDPAGREHRSRRALRVRAHGADLIGAGGRKAAFARVQVLE